MRKAKGQRKGRRGKKVSGSIYARPFSLLLLFLLIFLLFILFWLFSLFLLFLHLFLSFFIRKPAYASRKKAKGGTCMYEWHMHQGGTCMNEWHMHQGGTCMNEWHMHQGSTCMNEWHMHQGGTCMNKWHMHQGKRQKVAPICMGNEKKKKTRSERLSISSIFSFFISLISPSLCLFTSPHQRESA